MEEEKGQTLLIVVLVMVIALTVALSLVSRTVTNLRNSNEEANSQKAFSAAEAGVEEALKTGVCSSSSCPNPTGSLNNNNAKFSAAIKSLPSVIDPNQFVFNNGDAVAKDDGVDLWLIAHNSDGSLKYNSGWQLVTNDRTLEFVWGSSSDTCNVSDPSKNTMAALKLIVLSEPNAASDSAASVKSARYAFDPCSARRAQDNFTSSAAGISVLGKSFSYSADIVINANSGILVRAVPMYANTSIGVIDTTQSCPAGEDCSLSNQGSLINSTGTYGQTTRTITVFQGYPELPSEFFPYILFSP